MKLVFSQGGERDFEQIVDHIARDNPRRALSFVRELRAAARALVRNPEGRPRANFDSRIRRSVHRGYNLYYPILPGEIRILAVIHGSPADDAVLFDLVKR
jgi:toxin ParE1/3/4